MSDDIANFVIMANADAIKRGALAIWTVYDRPKDYPDGYIARLHEAGKGSVTATGKTVTGELEHIRKVFWRAGLLKLSRQEGDEPQVVESWV
jgi:hypothetical protein